LAGLVKRKATKYLRVYARNCGIIYSAAGERFVAEAIASAKSSLRFNRVPHVIFCNPVPAKTAEGIDLIRYEPDTDPHLDKIHNISNFPFERTIYLDCDTYVTGNIDELFDLLNRFDVAAAHAPGYTKHADRGQSEAFYDFNTGVIAIRKVPSTAKFLANWASLHARWLKAPPFNIHAQDQAAFRRALWESRLSLYVLSPEYNYRSIFPGRLVGQAKIIHGRSTNYEKLAANLNAVAGPRVLREFPPEWVW